MSLSLKKYTMLIAALAFHITGYLGMNTLMEHRGISHSVALSWDYQIPYIKYFSPVYAIVYFIPVVTFFLCWNNYEIIKAAFKSFITAGVICFTSYAIFPVMFSDRIALHPPYDFFDNVTRFFYWIDKPYNCFPSLHVALAFISVQVIERASPKLSLMFWTVAILVTLSTLFVRQHYILDLVAGITVAYAIGWYFIPKEVPSSGLVSEEIA